MKRIAALLLVVPLALVMACGSKTVTDKAKGFSISYPSGWNKLENELAVMFKSKDGKAGVSVFVYDKKNEKLTAAQVLAETEKRMGLTNLAPADRIPVPADQIASMKVDEGVRGIYEFAREGVTLKMGITMVRKGTRFYMVQQAIEATVFDSYMKQAGDIARSFRTIE